MLGAGDIPAFDRLEEKVERLVKLCGTLESEKRDLKEILRLKETEIGELRKKLGKIEKEKGAVKDKVDGLIDRLDGLIQSA